MEHTERESQPEKAVSPPALMAHTRKRSRAWWLKLSGLALMAASALLFLGAAAAISEAPASIPAVLIAACIYLGWRKPGAVGAFLVAFAPLGALGALAGSTNLDPAWQVIAALMWFAGLPLVSGLLLIAAARPRIRSS
jgi:hypothetical protein